MHRLIVHIVKPKRVDLLDQAIPSVKGNHESRSLTTDEISTPVGLPLRFFVRLGPTGDTLRIQTAGTDLLYVALGSLGGEVGLLLSTEEWLRISILETR
jgi:hypothetical protein